MVLILRNITEKVSVANGAVDPKPALIISLVRLLIIFVPLFYLQLEFFGLSGIYAAIAESNILVGAAAMIWTSRRCRGAPAVA